VTTPKPILAATPHNIAVAAELARLSEATPMDVDAADSATVDPDR
jgi:hypothetical protein